MVAIYLIIVSHGKYLQNLAEVISTDTHKIQTTVWYKLDFHALEIVPMNHEENYVNYSAPQCPVHENLILSVWFSVPI